MVPSKISELLFSNFVFESYFLLSNSFYYILKINLCNKIKIYVCQKNSINEIVNIHNFIRIFKSAHIIKTYKIYIWFGEKY